MQTCEKNNPLKKEGTDPSDEDFKLLIKELLYYNEALKCHLDQIELSSTLEKQLKNQIVVQWHYNLDSLDFYSRPENLISLYLPEAIIFET